MLFKASYLASARPYPANPQQKPHLAHHRRIEHRCRLQRPTSPGVCLSRQRDIAGIEQPCEQAERGPGYAGGEEGVGQIMAKSSFAAANAVNGMVDEFVIWPNFLSVPSPSPRHNH